MEIFIGKKVLPGYFANYGATFQGGNVHGTPWPLQLYGHNPAWVSGDSYYA
jgi:hypothetical protein